MKPQPYQGTRYRVVVSAHGSRVVVQVQPAAPMIFAGPGPGYTRCRPGERVWWKPWTWSTVDAAVLKCNRIARRMEAKESVSEGYASQYRHTRDEVRR